MSIIFTISFDYPIDKAGIVVRLQSDIESDDTCQGVYKASRFRTTDDIAISLPEVILQKVGGFWIHRDCGKESNLSQAIGHSIEQYMAMPDAASAFALRGRR